MRITELLKSSGIDLTATPTNKQTAIEQLAELMDRTGCLSDKQAYLKAVLEREASGTTGLGDGIATPHAKSPAVRQAGLAAMVVKDGLDFEALYGQP